MGGSPVFEWDAGKAESNLDKHAVTFAFATMVFIDTAAVHLDVTRSKDAEPRRKAIGRVEGRLYTVVYTLRAEVIRIISARRCNDKEARAYGPVHPRSN